MIKNILGALFAILFSVSSMASNIVDVKTKAVTDLIERTLPGKSHHFRVEFIDKEVDGKDVFEISSVGNTILLKGNNGISVASALNYYLKNFANCHISWNGSNLNLPDSLPAIPEPVKRKSPYKYRYYLNYCTFNYTMSWWQWERWQKEIDWMALNGINMPLAVTGQNSVWQRVYNSLGLSNSDLESFFSGPAYFNWFWMGNLDGWGGPLPQSFMTGHEALQKKILAQERLMGMTPVLPAFTGHVPPAFEKKYPKVKLKHTTWVGFPKVSILDPAEPMFDEIGRRFIREQINTYGTDHLYSADTFNENTPPTKDSLYLNDISKKVYQTMADVDPKASWVMQGWLFYHDKKYWGDKEIQALLNGVPNDKMIILDLWSERYPVWSRTDAYYGKPWIWNMLHNFGQNISMSGVIDRIAAAPSAALHHPKAGKMAGIGLTMEGIEQNPVVYDLMLENVWRDTPIDLNSWLKQYASRRYGKTNVAAGQAWELLRHSAYNDTITNGGNESIITARPTFVRNPGGTSNTRIPYDSTSLVKAWHLLVQAAPELKASNGFQYDLVDVTRQVLANYALHIQQQMAKAYELRNRTQFNECSDRFIALISDMDDLLATRKEFLLGKWLEEAKKWGTTPAEKALYEQNARNLLTLWGDKECSIHEYACKQWSGMMNGFYKKRWQMFIDHVNIALDKSRKFNQKKFDKMSKEWEWSWINAQELYPTENRGDAVEAATGLYRKYYAAITRDYSMIK